MHAAVPDRKFIILTRPKDNPPPHVRLKRQQAGRGCLNPESSQAQPYHFLSAFRTPSVEKYSTESTESVRSPPRVNGKSPMFTADNPILRCFRSESVLICELAAARPRRHFRELVRLSLRGLPGCTQYHVTTAS
ncbi:hypothetical protein THAOC_06142 [Thalassiosira oceanica]|uniref:Uncharacterized protein n=1 Tax=Thalassiosira oceanica TaxID=159749 RepID=K0TM19_THAOC|nr:hypothetical protein THAOC_06142 [Thalassiosira oceanica]|eukprot:EJK72337.1 hypothetical protein THAOC_06142 [Thalassiosira oceanica]